MKEHYAKWHSPTLGMETEMLIFGHSGHPVIIFPTSMGSYHQNRDFHLINSVKWFVDNGIFKIYCPDSADNYTFYNKNIHPAERIKNHLIYDRFILDEIVAGAINDTGHQKVTTAGCSFGGYHAVNFALRHPDKVTNTISMGGAFDIKSHLDGYYDDHVYYNNPVDFLGGLNDHNLWQMGIFLGVGEHDFCLPENRRLSEIMHSKGMHHWLDIRPGETHDWPVWRAMLPDYFGRMLSMHS